MKNLFKLIILFIALYCNLNKVYCQATSGYYTLLAAPNRTSGNGDFIGWDGTQTIPLQIRTNANYRINFYTDSVFRVVIDTTKGFVGIGGYFSTNPTSYLLDVDSGDINIGRSGVTDKFGYRIGHNYVLWNNGNVRNIYVGVNAGKANAAASAVNNTFCGYDAGNYN